MGVPSLAGEEKGYGVCYSTSFLSFNKPSLGIFENYSRQE
jgi:hypothetical protein